MQPAATWRVVNKLIWFWEPWPGIGRWCPRFTVIVVCGSFFFNPVSPLIAAAAFLFSFLSFVFLFVILRNLKLWPLEANHPLSVLSCPVPSCLLLASQSALMVLSTNPDYYRFMMSFLYTWTCVPLFNLLHGFSFESRLSRLFIAKGECTKLLSGGGGGIVSMDQPWRPFCCHCSKSVPWSKPCEP